MKFLILALLLVAALARSKPVFPVFYSSPGYQPATFAAPYGVSPFSYVATGVQPQVLLKSTQAGQAVSNTPVVYSVPAVAPLTQHSFHSQDGKGAYSFGYYGGPSSRAEARDHFGNVRGSYNYIDAEGKVQSAQYTAGKEGFNVAATNLPVSPEVPKKTKVNASYRKKRSADPSFFYSTNTYQTPFSYVHHNVQPVNPIPTPLTYSAVHATPTPVVYSAYSGATPLKYSSVNVPLAHGGFPLAYSAAPFYQFGAPFQFKAGAAKLDSHNGKTVIEP